MKKFSSLFVFFAVSVMFNLSNYPCAAQWVQGTGIDGGDYRCFTMSGTDIFVGSQYGGVFRSSDNGVSWTPKYDGLPPAVSIVSLYTSGTTLFAGTGAWSFNGQGVFRSIDNGNNWTSANTGIQDVNITGITGAKNFIFASTSDSGVYRSSDNGDTWTNVFNAFGPGSSFREIETVCTVGETIFAGGTTGTGSAGIYRSTDFGLTWTLKNTGFPDGCVVYQLVSSANNLFARTSHGIYWTPSQGDFWISIMSGIPTTYQTGTRTLCSDGTNLFLSTYADGYPKLFRSIDMGTSWTEITTLSTYYIMGLMANGTTVLAGNIGNFTGSNGGGVLRSDDNGDTWTQSSQGLSGLNGLSLTANSTGVFAGTSYNTGIFTSTNNGTSWVRGGLSTNNQIEALINNGTDLYAGVYQTGVYRSSDNGQTWSPTAAIGSTVFALTSKPGYIFAGTQINGMRRSVNNGTTWVTINNGLTTTQSKSIRSLACNGSDVFAGTLAGGIYRSTNNGDAWVAVNNGLPTGSSRTVRALVFSGTNLYAGTGEGFFRSSDNGASWVAANNGLTNLDVRAITTDGTTIFAGTYGGGVFKSTDYGASWIPFNDGLSSNEIIFSLTVANGNLYAGTYGHSICNYSLAQSPAAFSLTGGGAYCANGSGLPVGISNSELGVVYTLYKNGVAQIPTVAGTGSAITFGLQLFGSYTASGANGSGSTPMTGTVVITETPAQAVSVTISPDVNPVPAGSTITFTAIPVNGGSAPSYQWSVNGVNAGTDSPTYSFVPVDADMVTCTLISSNICTTGNPAVSNQVTIMVIPENINLENIIVADGETNCYDALQSIHVAGSGTTFTVQNGGTATMIAGQNIVFFPGTKVEPGGTLHGYITLTGDYCANPTNPVVSNPLQYSNTPASIPEMMKDRTFRIYPNPANSSFTIDLKEDAAIVLTNVEIFSMNGLKMLAQDGRWDRRVTVSVPDLRPGIYFIQVTAGNIKETLKLIKL